MVLDKCLVQVHLGPVQVILGHSEEVGDSAGQVPGALADPPLQQVALILLALILLQEVVRLVVLIQLVLGSADLDLPQIKVPVSKEDSGQTPEELLVDSARVSGVRSQMAWALLAASAVLIQLEVPSVLRVPLLVVMED